MIKLYSPPLAVNFIWHPSDRETVNPILDNIRIGFARDKEKPFSRGLNIPLFFYSSQNSQEIPSHYPDEIAKNNIIFVFTSKNTLGINEWKKYIEGLPQPKSIKIVPIAIDSYGKKHNGSLSNLNCIKFNDWADENIGLNAAVALAHEIYRFGCNNKHLKDKGSESSIKIFLSHSKSDDSGKKISEKIKQFIDNSNMRRFFDTDEISPGFRFDQEIEKHIQDSTLLAIVSDTFSSRYWCQRELLFAKEQNCPVVVVNCLEDFEDRIFPAASNVPCVHISSAEQVSEKDILRILSTALIETVRYNYSMQCLEAYRKAGWIDKGCELIARPPEIRQVLNYINNGVKKICYPEPPVYMIETDWHNAMGVQAFTPLWNPIEKDSLSDKRVGISISDISVEDFTTHHLHADQLVRLSQDLARYLLAQSATLLYGGDLRPGGFTEFILDEASIVKDRISEVKPIVENHLAWPLYVSDQEITEWNAKYNQVLETIEYEIPSDVETDNLDTDTFLPPNSPQNLFIWSRCLSDMRVKSICTSTARICAGGRLTGYKGKMPGVLEEIELALNAQKPIYLLGAFGGVVGEVCKLILTSEVPEPLTAKWQIEKNEGYSDLQELACSHGHNCDFEALAQSILTQNITTLALNSGLAENEYKRLMVSPLVDECVYLVLKGLKRI